MLPRLRPAVVVGFGGYPTIPPLLAASVARHSDADPRAERGDGPRQPDAGAARPRHRDRLCRHSRSRSGDWPAKATHTGNPVRPAVIAAAATPYPPLDTGGPLQLLVFGGSQGARVMADIVPPAHRKARAALADAAEDRAAGARGGPAARPRHLCEAAGRLRRGAVLQRPAGAHGGEPSRGVALGGVDRRRTCRDRPPGHPRPAAACARPGSARQRRRADGCGRRDPPRSGGIHPRAARDRDRGLGRGRPAASPPWRRPPRRPVRSTPPTGSPIWCCGWRV